MEAIKQYFDIEEFDSVEANKKGITDFILKVICDKEKCVYKRIVDADGCMVSLYKEKEDKSFLLVISTGIGKGQNNFKTNYYIVTPKDEEGEHYTIIGSLVRQLLKENHIPDDIALKDFKEVVV